MNPKWNPFCRLAAPYCETYSTNVPIHWNYNDNNSIMASLEVHFAKYIFTFQIEHLLCKLVCGFLYKKYMQLFAS